MKFHRIDVTDTVLLQLMPKSNSPKTDIETNLNSQL